MIGVVIVVMARLVQVGLPRCTAYGFFHHRVFDRFGTARPTSTRDLRQCSRYRNFTGHTKANQNKSLVSETAWHNSAFCCRKFKLPNRKTDDFRQGRGRIYLEELI